MFLYTTSATMKRKYILPILLPVQFILVQILSLFPAVIEQYYSKALYIYISNICRTITGKVSFSIGDVIYFILIALLLRWLWIKRKSWRKLWKENLLQILSWFSIFYFLFNFLWAINYHRVPLHEKMGFETEYSDTDLLVFTQKLIVKTNSLHLQITKDSTMKVVVPFDRDAVYDKNVSGYQNLEKRYSAFRYDKPSVKNSLLSLPLTYMGFSGYMNPFTGEAQVNNLVPMYSFPATASHEMAHQLGYASESEANFVGFLAAVSNDDLYMQYSGYTLALRYCLRNWQIRDEKKAAALLKTLNPGIRKNFDESKAFWEQHETFIESGFKLFYDNFLKFNQQEEGLESYSRFVDMIVNYYKTRSL